MPPGELRPVLISVIFGHLGETPDVSSYPFTQRQRIYPLPSPLPAHGLCPCYRGRQESLVEFREDVVEVIFTTPDTPMSVMPNHLLHVELSCSRLSAISL